MIRALAVVLVILVGVAVQLWLAYGAAYWAWVSATPNANLARVRRNFYVCSIPCFAIFIAQVAIIWFAAVRPWRIRRRRMMSGQCVGCGYDLTGNVSGRCPECGEMVDGDAD